MLRIEKIGGKKVNFQIFFAESWKKTLGKEILSREQASWLSAKKYLPSDFFFTQSFLFGSQQRTEL
jgi:hypothetical protein